MNEFRTALDVAVSGCPASLPICSEHYPCVHSDVGGGCAAGEQGKAGMVHSVEPGRSIAKRLKPEERRNAWNSLVQRISGIWEKLSFWIATLALSLSVAACASGLKDLVPDQSKVGVSVSGIGHYGRMIGIPGFSIDGFHAGNVEGWGGGGGGFCCVLLPRVVTKPINVNVKWESCDIGHIKFVNDRIVDRTESCKLESHEARVPIHFTVQPGEGGSGLKVHFLPGHKVEVWYTPEGPASTEYLGPPYPRGPAPDYAPLPDEKPAATSVNQK
ncbi:hypothetical protein BH10PSE18_BH10PSE18_13250 [soil metagenome]